MLREGQREKTEKGEGGHRHRHSSCPQEPLQLLVGRHHSHRGAAQNVGGSHQGWIPNASTEMNGLLHCGELRPLRLVDPQVVAKLTELVPVFAHVDGLDGGAQDFDAILVERHRQVVGRLSSNRYHRARWMLELANLQNSLTAELLEVEAIRLVEISGDCLRVAIDDDGLT